MHTTKHVSVGILLAVFCGCSSVEKTSQTGSSPQLIAPQQLFGSTSLSGDEVEEKHAPNRTVDLIHTKLTLALDWTAKSVKGEAEISFEPFSDSTQTLTLDAGDMKIESVNLALWRVTALENRPPQDGMGTPAQMRRRKKLPPPARYDTVIQTLGYPAESGTEYLKVDRRSLKPLAFTHDTTENRLSIVLDKPYRRGERATVQITYTATPQKRGLFFIAPDSAAPSKRYEVWSQGEAEDNHFWFPTWDSPNEKMTTELVVTVGDSMKTLSNGKRIRSTKNADGTRTDHWKMSKPHAPYLVTLVVGDYKVITEQWGTVPVEFYLTPKKEKYAPLIYGRTKEMMAWFSEKTGYPYPWEKYAQVAVTDFTAGGMENTTATTMYEFIEVDERGAIDFPQTSLIAHELAHQWWGDVVTSKDWANLTLNEGFATFFAAAYYEKAFGNTDMQNEFLGMEKTYFRLRNAGRNRPIVSRKYRDPLDMFDGFTYEKGGFVLEMLRYTLGETDFWRVINRYITTHQFQTVDLGDLQKSVEQVTGKNLHWFFDQWYRRAGHPEFECFFVWYAPENLCSVRLRQTQPITAEQPAFITPMDIEFVFPDGSRKSERIMASIDDSTYRFTLQQAPKYIVLDKAHRILKKVAYLNRPAEIWMDILSTSDAMPARAEAADSLRRYLGGKTETEPVNPAVRDALIKALQSDAYFSVRKAAATALGSIKTDAATKTADASLSSNDASVTSKALSVAATADKKSSVRTEAVNALASFKGKDIETTLRQVMTNDSSYVAVAAAINALAKVSPKSAFDLITPFLAQDSYRDLVRKGVLDAYAALKDRRALESCIRYAKAGNANAVRDAAMRALSAVATAEDSSAVEALVAVVSEKNPPAMTAFLAQQALSTLKPKPVLPRLKALWEAEKRDLVRKQNLRAVIDAIEKN